MREPLLDVADGVVAEVSDEAAIEARESFHGRDPETVHEGFDVRERVVAIRPLHHGAVGGDGDVVRRHFQYRSGRQPDDRVASPLFAAVRRFEQIGVRTAREL